MQTILRILERAGGWNPGLFLKIANAPSMALVIEAIEEGPSGLPTLSVTHFDLIPVGSPHPVLSRQQFLSVNPLSLKL